MVKVFDAEPDGSRKLTSGPFRAVLHAKTIEVAPDVFSSEICNAFMFRNTWYFVTSDGDIFRAASFLGRPIDVVASVGRVAILSTVVHDAVVLADIHHALWSFDGQRSVRVKAPGPVTGIGQDANGSPSVLVCGRWYTFHSAGVFTPRRPEPVAKAPKAKNRRARDAEGSSDLDKVRLLNKVHEALEPTHAVSDNALWAIDNLIALRDGSFKRWATTFGDAAADDCNLLQAGSEAIVYCVPPKGSAWGSEQPPAVVYRFGPDGTPQRWMDISSFRPPTVGPGPSLLVESESDDIWIHAGRRDSFYDQNVMRIPCDSPDTQPAPTRLGLSGSWLLMSRTCDQKESYEVIDLGSRDAHGKVIVTPLLKLLPESSQVLDATLSADQSTLSVVMHDAAGRMAVALGAAGGKLTVHPMPQEAKAAAFADARRGIAIGKHLGQVWTTTDGAAQWTRLVLPIEGDPAAVPITDPPTCSTLACRSGAAVVWANPRALRETGYHQPRVMAPSHAPATRTYDGPHSRRESASPPRDSAEDEHGCPNTEAPPR
jgi:hypothetical protein